MTTQIANDLYKDLYKDLVYADNPFLGLFPEIWNINKHYGPAVKFQGKRRYLIDEKYLTSKEYKAFMFDKEMKDLLE